MPVLLLLCPYYYYYARPASAAQAADWPRLAGGWPRLAEARGSLRRDLALKKNTNGDPQRQLLAKA
jgi:hypothetical protein